MTEPTYEYVKGKGWIPCTGSIIVQYMDGDARIEFRMPEVGERYNYLFSPDPNWFEGDTGVFDIEKMRKTIRGYHMRYENVMTDDDMIYFLETPDPSRHFFTIIPL